MATPSNIPRFYITNLFEGTCTTTNDPQLAASLSEVAEFFVVDIETQTWRVDGGDWQHLKAQEA